MCGLLGEVSPRFLDAAAQHGYLVLGMGGHWRVVADYRDPMSDRSHRYTAAACQCLYLRPDQLVATLLAELSSSMDSALLRVPAGWQPEPSRTGRRVLRYVRTKPQQLGAGKDRDLPAEVTIATSGAVGEDFVRDRLTAAYVETHQTTARSGILERAHDVVSVQIAESGPWRWWVAMSGATPVAYIVFDLDAWDDVTAEPVIELIDQLVLPQAPGGCLPALLAAAADHCPDTIGTVLGKVHVDSPDPDGIYQRLTDRDWQPAFDLWEFFG
jgi:hypothetical protein